MEYSKGPVTLNSVCWPAQAQFFPQKTKVLDSAPIPTLDRAGKPSRSPTLAIQEAANVEPETRHAVSAMERRHIWNLLMLGYSRTLAAIWRSLRCQAPSTVRLR